MFVAFIILGHLWQHVDNKLPHRVTLLEQYMLHAGKNKYERNAHEFNGMTGIYRIRLCRMFNSTCPTRM